jgi:hypothetical protein
MKLHHNDYVSVYDKNGNFECRGYIVGIYGLTPEYYDVQPAEEYSLKKRICGLPAARVRKHFVPDYIIDSSAKHIMDEA